MVILFHHNYRIINVGTTTYRRVSWTTWECWKRFCQWGYDIGWFTPLEFQGGWVIKL